MKKVKKVLTTTNSSIKMAKIYRRIAVGFFLYPTARRKMCRAFSYQILYGRLRLLRICATMLSVVDRVLCDIGLLPLALFAKKRMKNENHSLFTYDRVCNDCGNIHCACNYES